VIEKVKPTIVVPPEVRLILSEAESLEVARIFLLTKENGDQILITEPIDIHDSRGNWSHLLLFLSQVMNVPSLNQLLPYFFRRVAPASWYGENNVLRTTEGGFRISIKM
jgi:hypothetical protein